VIQSSRLLTCTWARSNKAPHPLPTRILQTGRCMVSGSKRSAVAAAAAGRVEPSLTTGARRHMFCCFCCCCCCLPRGALFRPWVCAAALAAVEAFKFTFQVLKGHAIDNLLKNKDQQTKTYMGLTALQSSDWFGAARKRCFNL